MTRRVLLAVGVALVLSSAAHAQDGLRSASLPERPIASAPPGPTDLFRATVDTYRPHERPDHPVPRPPINGRGSGPGHPGRGGGWPPATGWGGYWPYYPEVEPTPAHVEPELKPSGGRLQLRVAPGDALVYIDGEFEGAADDLREPGALLRAGSHRVRVEASGFATHTFDVRLDDGETVTRRVALDRTPAAPAPRPAGALPGARADNSTPQTMYVIPRCYAGNKPPDPATRCDLTQLRTIR